MRFAYVMASSILLAASASWAGTDRGEARKPGGGAYVLAPQAFASDSRLAKGCWARLYLAENFAGDALTIVGPLNIDYVRPPWGFEWDPRYESVIVGPAATLTVYDDPSFANRTGSFKAGQRIADLDSEMGIFRTIRSMKVTCAAAER